MKRRGVPWWRNEFGLETKRDVEERIRWVVRQYGDGVPLDRADEGFILGVLKHHHQFVAKTGVGLKHVEIRTNPSWNGSTRGFWFVRQDGTAIDISWVTALCPDGKPTQKDYVIASARYEIHAQIHAYHATGDCVLCPLCGDGMIRRQGVHVDHVIPFDSLLTQWAGLRNLSYEDIAIEDLGLETQFLDRSLAQDWQTYHEKSAVLRLTHARCNLSRR